MKTYGICPLSLVCIYTKPTKKSEIVSQLLFGETFELIEEEEDWVKIRCSWDGCDGWIDNQQFEEIDLPLLEEIRTNAAYSFEVSQAAMGSTHYLSILMGSTLPLYDGINMRLKGERFTINGQAIHPSQTNPSPELIIKIARKYLYTPYLQGGRSPFGIDAAGLTQMVFKMMGIALPRRANKQALRGKLVDFITDIQPGDIAFFENIRGRITHVGVVLHDDQILHATGKVRIDKLDHYGIFNTSNNRYTHKLRVVKRILT